MPATEARRATFDPSAQHRRAMIAKAHVAKKQLQIDEDDYRQIIFEASGQTSLAACNDGQLVSILDRFKTIGFRPVANRGQRAAAQHPMARKARALWISLHHLGVVRNPSEQALEAFAKRQLGCERLVWARQADAYRLIEALKSMGGRAGWRQTSLVTQKPLTPRELQSHLCEVILGKLRDADIVPASWTLDQAAWSLCGIDTANTEHGFTAESYALLAKALGDKLRDAGHAENAA